MGKKMHTFFGHIIALYSYNSVLVDNDAFFERRIPIIYKKELTKDKLEYIVIDSIQSLDRVQFLSLHNGVITLSIDSISAKSQWTCFLDFNDNGKISGKYWVYSSNKDSTLPRYIAETISDSIIDYYDDYNSKLTFKDKLVDFINGLLFRLIILLELVILIYLFYLYFKRKYF